LTEVEPLAGRSPALTDSQPHQLRHRPRRRGL